jgi:hypothetical protein
MKAVICLLALVACVSATTYYKEQFDGTRRSRDLTCSRPDLDLRIIF